LLIHALYLFKHSQQGDRELRFSLRSLEKAAPWVGKVWVFGDRPAWLGEDKAIVEHVPHEYIARANRWNLPLRNQFLSLFAASLIPGLSEEFLFFADDYILLQPIGQADLCRVRVLEDLSQTKNRGQGVWKASLWRTYDTLQRLGYGGLNFEVHVPQFYTRKRIWEAYCDLRDYVSEDRFFGLLCHTAILNHALKQEPGMELVWISAEGRKTGFHGKSPSSEEVRRQCEGKTFLNFDDNAWGGGLEQFLEQRFPERSRFERAESEVCAVAAPTWLAKRPDAGTGPITLDAGQLTEAFAKAISSRGQMSPPQYLRVLLEIFRRGPCNLLVIGAGRDTELYVRANAGGRTVVLERQQEWIERIGSLGCEVIAVQYGTRLDRPPLDPCQPPDGVPPELLQLNWDIVLVDGPEGNRQESPGRQQSIYLASLVARGGTTVFLHDWNRPAEQRFAAKYLKPVDERCAGQQTLAVFQYPK